MKTIKPNVRLSSKTLLNKGFTLIELLAVIVILAIIAVIAVPIILNTIEDMKKEAVELSFKNYLRAVEQAIMNKEVMDEKVLDGEYKITDKGTVLEYQDGAENYNGENDIKVEFEGEVITEGIIILDQGEVKTAENVIIGEYVANYENGIIETERIDKQEEVESIKVPLVTGASFNAKIKTLANETTIKYDTEDTKVTAIEFYSNRKLPKGYSKTKLNNLASKVDVSLNGDGSIIAYYEDGKVYVVSDNLISFNSNSSSMFFAFKSLTNIEFSYKNQNMIDTSEATNMSFMFHSCSALTTLDVSKFNTSKVTSMNAMFKNCSSLTSLDLSGFDTIGVTDMASMFISCRSLEKLDVRNWNTSNVTTMSYMFHVCSSLTSLDVSNFDTSKVKNIEGMFWGCSELVSLDVSNFDTSQVTSMGNMFHSCSALTTLDVSNFNTSKVTSMGSMFNGCGSLTSLDISDFDTSEVTAMSSMFGSCSSLTSLDVSKWNTSKVTNMVNMFSKTKNLNEIIIGCGWVTSSSNSNMFLNSGYTLDKLNERIEEIKPTCPAINE